MLWNVMQTLEWKSCVCVCVFTVAREQPAECPVRSTPICTPFRQPFFLAALLTCSIHLSRPHRSFVLPAPCSQAIQLTFPALLFFIPKETSLWSLPSSNPYVNLLSVCLSAPACKMYGIVLYAWSVCSYALNFLPWKQNYNSGFLFGRPRSPQ